MLSSKHYARRVKYFYTCTVFGIFYLLKFLNLKFTRSIRDVILFYIFFNVSFYRTF